MRGPVVQPRRPQLVGRRVRVAEGVATATRRRGLLRGRLLLWRLLLLGPPLLRRIPLLLRLLLQGLKLGSPLLLHSVQPPEPLQDHPSLVLRRGTRSEIGRPLVGVHLQLLQQLLGVLTGDGERTLPRRGARPRCVHRVVRPRFSVGAPGVSSSPLCRTRKSCLLGGGGPRIMSLPRVGARRGGCLRGGCRCRCRIVV